MTDRCLLRIRPRDFEKQLASLDEFSEWEPCPDPVVIKIKDYNALGGWFMLCAKHQAELETSPTITPPWVTK